MFAEVYIATTHGLVRIQSIASFDDPDIRSVVTINHTSKLAGISDDYADFVSVPTGIIQEAFLHSSFRLNISDNISQGQSWQLGCYVAHYVKSIEALSECSQSESATSALAAEKKVIIVSTGVIDTVNRKVLRVESLPRKCLTANAQIQKWLEQGNKVVFLAPIDNLKDPIPDSSIQLTPIFELKELPNLFNALGYVAPTSGDVSETFSKDMGSNSAVLLGNTATRKNVSSSIVAAELAKPDQPATNTFGVLSKVKANYIWLTTLLLACVFVLLYFMFPTSSTSVITLVTESGRDDQCSTVSTAVAFSQISNATKEAESQVRFNAIPTYLQSLCGIRVITSKEIDSIFMVTDSKGLISLSHNQIVKTSDVDLIQSYSNNPLSGQNELLSWEVPLPANQSLARTYYLVISKHSFDQADIQSIEAELLKFYQTGRPISHTEIFAILSAIEAKSQHTIITHLLKKT